MSKKTAPVPPLPGEESQGAEHKRLMLKVSRERDRQSFIELYNYFAPRVKSYLMKSGLTEAHADELAQETMLNVWQKADLFDPTRAGVGTWIFTLARNKRIDLQRRSAGVYHVGLEDAPEMQSGHEEAPAAMAHAQEVDFIAAALKDLPHEQAQLLQKSFFEDKSHAQIAKETGIPLGTIKSRIRMALEKLRNNEKVRALW